MGAIKTSWEVDVNARVRLAGGTGEDDRAARRPPPVARLGAVLAAIVVAALARGAAAVVTAWAVICRLAQILADIGQ